MSSIIEPATPSKDGSLRTPLSTWVLLAVGILGILVTLSIEVFTDADIAIQDHLYNFQTGEWLVNPRARVPRFIFYTLPKLILYPAGAFLLVTSFSHSLRRKLKLNRRASIYLFSCLACIPLVAGIGKNVTHVHCPSELQRYGGTEPYAKVITKQRPPYNRIPPHCFPAGHASGGFALVALYFVHKRWRWLLPGLVAGWTMGLYQMFKGAHFLSHTLTTMFLALALTAALSPILYSKVKSSIEVK
jgi:membrane-associated PAP2 superfamily phosphatase